MNTIIKHRKKMSSSPDVSNFSFFFVYCLFCYVTAFQNVLVRCESTSPNNQSIQQIGGAVPNDVTTQTVYGFLDFTTTIGNTVMVFSPQSSSVTTSGQQITSHESTTVINEKPTPAVSVTTPNIQPNKTTPAAIVNPIVQKEHSEKVSGESKHADAVAKKQLPPVKITLLKDAVSTNGNNSKNKDTPKSSKGVHQNVTKSSSSSSADTKSVKPEKGNKSFGKPVIISSKVELVTSLHTATPNLKPKKQEKPPKAATLEKPVKISEKPTTNNNNNNNKTDKNNKSSPKVVSSKVEVRIMESSTKPPSVIEKGDADKKVSIISSKVEVKETESSGDQTSKHTEELSSTSPGNKEIKLTTSAEIVTKNASSTEAITEEPAVISSNSVVSPEYDFLSRQPSEVVDETFKVIELRPNSGGKYQKPKNTAHRSFGSSGNQNQFPTEEDHPTGLVTSMADSVVKDGHTTVYETNVIGTVISGKYAQVLQSTSHVIPNQKKIKPTLASSLGPRILKTAAPSIPRSSKSNLEPSSVYYAEEDTSITSDPSYYNTQQQQQFTGSSYKSSKKPPYAGASNGSTLKNRFYGKNKPKEDFKDDYGTTALEDEDLSSDADDYTSSGSNVTPPSTNPSTNSYKKATTKNNKATTTAQSNKTSPKYQNNRFGRPSSTTPELATVSVFSESVSSITPSYSSSGGGRRFTPSNIRKTTSGKGFHEERTGVTTKRSYNKQHKLSPSNVDANNINPSSSTYKFKLSRPSGRWQYKTSPKPRVTIRRQDDFADNVTVNPLLSQFTPDIQLDSSDQELSGSGLFPALQHEDNSIVQDISPSFTAETIRVEISTPADFKDVYYEIATIKSPYSFQVGTVKNTRFITVTSTYEKSLLQTSEAVIAPSKAEPLTENLLATDAHYAYAKEPPLDSSIVTLPPIAIAGNGETPPLDTLTETFSTTQLMLKTHILPVVRGGSDTTKYTLVQSYHVTRVVTATKTLPPMEVYQFVPSKTLNEFNTRLDEAGSELHLELDFGDNEHEEEANVAKMLLNDLDLTNIGSNFDISDVDKNKLLENHLRAKKAHKITTPAPSTTTENAPSTPPLSPEQLQQLALLRLLNPNAAVPNVLTSSKPIVKLETLYETHVIPIFNGANTFFTTITRPTATLTKTDFEYVTSTLPLLQPSVFNPLFPQQPSFHISTTPIITSTVVTQTDSKVIKLTFGAKTSYTTLFSTKVSPTVLTTYLTNSIPVQATAATFPGFFNPQYAPFPFMG